MSVPDRGSPWGVEKVTHVLYTETALAESCSRAALLNPMTTVVPSVTTGTPSGRGGDALEPLGELPVLRDVDLVIRDAPRFQQRLRLLAPRARGRRVHLDR